jgi:hypothetical protein
MRTVENLRIAIHILRFWDAQIGEHRVFVQSAFAKEAAPLENSRGFFVLDMAKRVEPSYRKRASDGDHRSERL